MYIKYLKDEFDSFQFDKELGDLKDKVCGSQHSSGVVTIYLSQTISPQEKIDLDTLVAAHSPEIDQKAIDEIRFQKRASAKNIVISKMAAGNLERVRNSVWSISDLVSLTQDPELKLLLDDVNTLSYEIAYTKIDTLTNPLITQDIKDEWKQLLLEHFYL